MKELLSKHHVIVTYSSSHHQLPLSSVPSISWFYQNIKFMSVSGQTGSAHHSSFDSRPSDLLQHPSLNPGINPETQPLLDETSHSTRPSRTMPLFYTLSTIFGASSVILGAFGAHGLKKRIADPARITNWSTAAQYQLIHSAVLLTMSLTLPRHAQRVPGALFVAGMAMFSGSIYLLVLDPQKFKALGPVTPLGGMCLIGGWIALGVVGRRWVPIR